MAAASRKPRPGSAIIVWEGSRVDVWKKSKILTKGEEKDEEDKNEIDEVKDLRLARAWEKTSDGRARHIRGKKKGETAKKCGIGKPKKGKRGARDVNPSAKSSWSYAKAAILKGKEMVTARTLGTGRRKQHARRTNAEEYERRKRSKRNQSEKKARRHTADGQAWAANQYINRVAEGVSVHKRATAG